MPEFDAAGMRVASRGVAARNRRRCRGVPPFNTKDNDSPMMPPKTSGTAATRPPKALTIAGIDPSGGAGVLADIKTFSALGAYGCGVVCALRVLSKLGVTSDAR